MVLMARKKMGGFPGGLNGKESICQCRRHGFNPWCRKIPHAAEQQSLWATTIEPAPCSKGSHHNEEPACLHTAIREQPPLATARERPMHQQRHSTAKNKHTKNFLNLTVNYLLKKKKRKKENGDLSATVVRR